MKKFKLTNLISAILAVITIGLVTVSCNSNSSTPGGFPDNMQTDFATLVSTSNDGTIFTLRKSGDSPLVTLSAAVKVDESVIKVGSRVIISYVPSGGQGVYESGPITLYGLAGVFNAAITKEPMTTIDSWQSQRLKMMMISRSGQYLDIWAELEYKTEPQRFVLAVDESTVDNDFPEVYLVFSSDMTSIGTPRQFYASFDLSSVWDLESCKGLVIHYNDTAGNKTLKLEKEGKLPLQPVE